MFSFTLPRPLTTPHLTETHVHNADMHKGGIEVDFLMMHVQHPLPLPTSCMSRPQLRNSVFRRSFTFKNAIQLVMRGDAHTHVPHHVCCIFEFSAVFSTSLTTVTPTQRKALERRASHSREAHKRLVGGSKQGDTALAWLQRRLSLQVVCHRQVGGCRYECLKPYR